MIVGFWNKLFKRDKPVKVFDTLVNAPEYVPGNDRSVLSAKEWDKLASVTIRADKIKVHGYDPSDDRIAEWNQIAKRWLREDLQNEIARLRRNKKKASHLVAELKKLEESE